MQSDLQKYLDGEIGREELTPEALREADRWETWNRVASTSFREHAPAWLENRTMVSLPTRPHGPLPTRLVTWLLEPRRIRIRPLPLGLAGAFVLVFALVLPSETMLRGVSNSPAGLTVVPVSSGSPVYVQFVLAAPDARSVAVYGDFNNWQTGGVALRDLDGDGVWTGMVPLRPGLHKYMFLVDGEEWVTDPRAERYLDDGFGGRNAVIAVAPPPARTL
ncbi:MAG: isoamylase early set domain-containing protein [Longimicrobiales bacterium]